MDTGRVFTMLDGITASLYSAEPEDLRRALNELTDVVVMLANGVLGQDDRIDEATGCISDVEGRLDDLADEVQQHENAICDFEDAKRGPQGRTGQAGPPGAPGLPGVPGDSYPKEEYMELIERVKDLEEAVYE